MWRYIPYSMYNCKGLNGGFYNNRKLFSFGCAVNIIIGARGYGKTFSIKKHCIKNFVYKDQQFVWVRDTVDAVKKLTSNNGIKFFEDVPLMEIDKLKDGKIEHGEIIINNKNCGCMLPASVFQNYKGCSYQNASIIVYDEFIKEKGRMKNKNNLWQTINTLFTIARSRENVKIIMMANALNKSDDFLNFLGVEIKDFGFYINKEKSICLHYADNTSNFNTTNSKGVVPKLIIGSCLDDNLIKSEFLNDSNLIINSLPAKAKLEFIIETPLQNARIYSSNGQLFVTDDVNKDTYRNKRYVIDLIHASRTKPQLALVHKKFLKENLEKNNIYFLSNYLHTFFIELLK